MFMLWGNPGESQLQTRRPPTPRRQARFPNLTPNISGQLAVFIHVHQEDANQRAKSQNHKKSQTKPKAKSKQHPIDGQSKKEKGAPEDYLLTITCLGTAPLRLLRLGSTVGIDSRSDKANGFLSTLALGFHGKLDLLAPYSN